MKGEIVNTLEAQQGPLKNYKSVEQRVRREAAKRRAVIQLAIEQRHDKTARMATWSVKLDILNRLQDQFGDRCPSCGEPADNATSLINTKNEAMLRCNCCHSLRYDRRGKPAPVQLREPADDGQECDV